MLMNVFMINSLKMYKSYLKIEIALSFESEFFMLIIILSVLLSLFAFRFDIIFMIIDMSMFMMMITQWIQAHVYDQVHKDIEYLVAHVDHMYH